MSIGGNLEDSPIPVKKVKGGRVREFRDNKVMVEEGALGSSTGFGGLRIKGI